jgi:hypothetical protein
MRHFKTKKEATTFRDERRKKGHSTEKVFKKIKGHKNRIQKPFVVGTEFEWLNLN